MGLRYGRVAATLALLLLVQRQAVRQKCRR